MTIEDQSDRVAIVTGSNTGIGEVTACELARAGARVYLACRSAPKATAAMARIRTEVPHADLHLITLDLGSLESVRRAAAEFLEREDELHILINNAGLAGSTGLTSDGFELAFGVNHLGPFLFTLLLVDTIVASAPARVVNVASKAHFRAKEQIDWDALREPTRSSTGFPEYSVSKLANILFTSELQRRLVDTEVSAFAVHPGVVASDIWRRVPWPFRSIGKMFMISPEEGARTSLHCATHPEACESDALYWDECQPKEPSALARDTAVAEELWARSLEWTGIDDPLG